MKLAGIVVAALTLSTLLWLTASTASAWNCGDPGVPKDHCITKTPTAITTPTASATFSQPSATPTPPAPTNTPTSEPTRKPKPTVTLTPPPIPGTPVGPIRRIDVSSSLPAHIAPPETGTGGQASGR